ncbi:sulfatase [Pontiella sulfatireligans]|uniref:Arylsulfatase n=1 Tax=Pontiella sulfatireligans TaxID=2750658 RepID=A0A6C2UD16_9BACT|nr:sulfatase [Pontiella sulfatireligans]SPS74118.1 sulfatase S1_7 [Kiritimatiellales bacterium]VGO18015.1 Arylsulfatase [Pontiella sulfatireligans]
MNNFHDQTTYRKRLATGIFLSLLASLLMTVAQADRPNVLFIAVDDLRPRLGCMGDAHAISPNIDQLADQGFLFKQAFCQAAACFPSRVSVLSGFRPESIGMTGTFESEKVPAGTIALPRQFKQHGYTTVMAGKVWHNSNDDTGGWTRIRDDHGIRGGYSPGYQLKSNQDSVQNYLKSDKLPLELPRSESCEMIDYPDDLAPDGVIAQIGIDELQKLSQDNKPFFLALGFYRPHLPYTPPKKYWDLFDPDTLPVPNFNPVQNGLQEWSSHELRRYGDIPNEGDLVPGSEVFSAEKARQLMHGYYASVAFADSQIGRVLNELKRLKLNENTIVVLWSDNGFSSGDHSWWGKYTNLRTSTQIALMISVPGKKKGVESSAFVELVDLYPTLCELTGIAKPDWLEGTSFAPLLDQPDRPWKEAVFTTAHGRVPAIRTRDYLLTIHKRNKTPGGSSYELFDLRKDPNETINVVDNPEYAPTVEKLLKQYQAGWKAAQPKGMK